MNEEITYLESSFPGQVESIDIRATVVNQLEDLMNNDTEEMLEFLHDSPYPVFEVPNRVAIRRAWNKGVSIFEHEDQAKLSDAREVYLEIASMLADNEAQREVEV